MNKFVKLKPFISNTIWAGSKLAEVKGIDPSEKIGETWGNKIVPIFIHYKINTESFVYAQTFFTDFCVKSYLGM